MYCQPLVAVCVLLASVAIESLPWWQVTCRSFRFSVERLLVDMVKPRWP